MAYPGLRLCSRHGPLKASAQVFHTRIQQDEKNPLGTASILRYMGTVPPQANSRNAGGEECQRRGMPCLTDLATLICSSAAALLRSRRH